MKARLIGTFLSAGLFCGGIAEAHVDIGSGPAVADATNEVVFTVGHGCTGSDTFKLVVDIPAGVTSVRPMRSDFGKPTVTKDMAGTITNVTWQKAVTDALDSDYAYYKLVIRLKTPKQPFSTIYFPAHQTCRAADGSMTTVEWVGVPGGPNPSAEPAAPLNLLPARQPGWNKFTVPAAIADLGVFFKDAQIVWKGAAAYSANANTAALISTTQGATALTALSAGDEIWVKY